jgi:hypothetical protein
MSEGSVFDYGTRRPIIEQAFQRININKTH